jgi:hypothetical protein
MVSDSIVYGNSKWVIEEDKKIRLNGSSVALVFREGCEKV